VGEYPCACYQLKLRLMPLKSTDRIPAIAMCVVLILHIVGFFGLQSTQVSQFEALTPLNLLIAFILMIPFSQSGKMKLVSFFLFSFTIGMLIEIIGVQTGSPFGTYSYTNIMSIAVFGVPILIGINWFMLAFGIISLMNLIYSQGSYLLKVGLSALIMMGMDVLIEPFAIKHNLWVWASDIVPLQNYLSWFVISFGIFLIGYKLLAKEKNKVAAFTILVFAIFFGLNLLVN
jgi:putative membrane protein